MAEKVSNDLIYEVLKSIQAQVVTIREDMDTVKTRLSSMDMRLEYCSYRYNRSIRTD